MPAGLVVPYRFARKTTALADQVNANFDAIVAKFAQGIVDGDIAVGADLDANKLSITAGKRLTATRFENNAVDNRVLANDTANPGTDSLRAVTGDHIRTLTLAHVARIVPAASILSTMLAVAAARTNLGYNAVTQAFSFATSNGQQTYAVAATGLPSLATIVPLSVTFVSIAGPGGAKTVTLGYDSTGAPFYVFLCNTTVVGPTAISGTLLFHYFLRSP